MIQKIIVADMKPICEKCRKECEEFDGFLADCSGCIFAELPRLTREEAIQKMHIGFFKVAHSNTEKSCSVKELLAGALEELLGARK